MKIKNLPESGKKTSSGLRNIACHRVMGLNVIVSDLRKCDNLISGVIASDHRERGNLIQ